MILKKKLVYFVFAFGLSISNATYSQQGKSDISFNTYDDGLFGDGFDGAVRTISKQSDEKLIVGGDFLNLNGANTMHLCRLFPDGSKDPSFAVGTGFNGNVYATLIQPDGKIIVGGSFTSFNGSIANRLIRLNNDGSWDPTFDTSVAASSGIVYSIALQTNGSLIIVGSFTKYNGNTANRIARILADGTHDTSFITGIAANALVEVVQIQSDNKIIIGGNFISFNGVPCNRIIRLNSTGSIDSTFNIGTGFDNDVRAIAVQTNGKILLGGDFIKYNGNPANRIIRVNTDGSVDNSFVTGTGFSIGYVSVVKVTALGEIMIGGSFNGKYNGIDVNRLVLLNSNGVLVPTFDIGDGPASAAVFALALDSNLSWYIGGSFSVFDSQNQGKLAKIDVDGTMDISYLTAGVGFDNSVLKVISLADTKTMVFGNFTKFNGANTSRITRLLDDGTIDLSFNSIGIGANNIVRTAVLQADGKIVFAGNFTSYNGVLINRICRILPDGAIDPTFLIGAGFTAQVYCLAVQADGKIIVGGNFTKFNGTTVNGIVRLLPNGSLDSSFTILGADGIIEAIVMQLDGKILIGGRFSNFNGSSHNKLVRLNTDGSVDSGFATEAGFDKNVYALALQSNNKIIVGGAFLNYKGASAKRIVRLNTNGSLDATFTAGSGFNKGDIRAILVQPDNQLLIGGTFTGTYNGKSVTRMVRLLPDGVYDASFIVDLNSTLFSMCFTVDAKVMIGGNFNSVSGITKHRIARLKLCTDSSVWNGLSWSNGFPSLGKALIFNANYDFTSTVNSCSCLISSGKTVVIKEGKTLGLTFEYSGLGTLILENSASLYQSDDEIENSGIMKLERKTTPVLNTDYTYWSSPVINQKLIDVSPNTQSSFFYSFDAIANNWKYANPNSTLMDKGIGYIIRGPKSYLVPNIYTTSFIGVPNNGSVSVSPIVSDKFYLLGNPYPSALDADSFLIENKEVLEGTLYFWTHNTSIQLASNITNGSAGTGLYAYTSDDYAAYNLTGGVGSAAAKSDPDKSEGNPHIPKGKIATGQSFFAKTKRAGSVRFINKMRVGGGESISNNNSQFFKVSNKKVKTIVLEKNRIWLNLENNKGAFKQVLVGYITGATNDYDNGYDGEVFNGNAYVNFYSVNQNKNLSIQARALPFDETDEVQLGFTTSFVGDFTISIDQTDGLLSEQNIFIEDKLLNKVYNLKIASYSFTTEKGTFDDRFVLRYTDKTLGNDTFDKEGNQLVISKDKKELKIKSEIETIKQVEIFDLLGKKVFENNMLDTTEFRTPSLGLRNQIVIVKVILKNGQVISKKVDF